MPGIRSTRCSLPLPSPNQRRTTIMNLFTVTAKRVVVTGGSSGIELAVAKAFLEEGAEVGIISRSGSTLADALAGPLADHTSRIHGRMADVADEAQMAEAFTDLGN